MPDFSVLEASFIFEDSTHFDHLNSSCGLNVTHFSFIKPLAVDGFEVSLEHFQGEPANVSISSEALSCIDNVCSWTSCFKATVTKKTVRENNGYVFCKQGVEETISLSLEMVVVDGNNSCLVPQNTSIVLMHPQRKY